MMLPQGLVAQLIQARKTSCVPRQGGVVEQALGLLPQGLRILPFLLGLGPFGLPGLQLRLGLRQGLLQGVELADQRPQQIRGPLQLLPLLIEPGDLGGQRRASPVPGSRGIRRA